MCHSIRDTAGNEDSGVGDEMLGTSICGHYTSTCSSKGCRHKLIIRSSRLFLRKTRRTTSTRRHMFLRHE